MRCATPFLEGRRSSGTASELSSGRSREILLKCCLTQEQINRLDQIGFNWKKQAEKCDMKWSECLSDCWSMESVMLEILWCRPRTKGRLPRATGGRALLGAR